MSLISEQINAIKYAGILLDDLLSIKEINKKKIMKKIVHITRHYPTKSELKIWKQWLIKCKGHE